MPQGPISCQYNPGFVQHIARVNSIITYHLVNNELRKEGMHLLFNGRRKKRCSMDIRVVVRFLSVADDRQL